VGAARAQACGGARAASTSSAEVWGRPKNRRAGRRGPPASAPPALSPPHSPRLWAAPQPPCLGVEQRARQTVHFGEIAAGPATCVNFPCERSARGLFAQSERARAR